jgi:3-isopropylmalate/(R)-2-methylmalate dehydratase small subunit
VTVDLNRQIVTSPGGREFSFEITPAERTALLEGLDEIGMSLREQESIASFEARQRAEFPWLQTVEQDEASEP